MTKMYISGPITNIPDRNRQAFDDAESFLLSLGHEVVNPFHLNPPGNSWHDCMKTDLKAMLECDELAMLDGWRDSKGACIEAVLAERLEMPVRHWRSGNPIHSPEFFVPEHAKESILQEAERVVNGPRRVAYNHPLDNFTSIAQLWSAFLGMDISAEQVGLMMILFKIPRENFKHGRDHLVDIAGYAQCIQIILDERELRENVAK